jgi:hypothetical protein
METTVVYPAIAIGYTVLCAPRFIRKTLPLVTGSILYLALSYWFIPKATAGPYRIHIDWHLPGTLLKYWVVALDPTSRREDYWPNLVVPSVLTVAIGAFVILRWLRRDRLPAFFLCWFVVAIAPVLPLRDQFQPYYLTVAAIGIAMLAAHAFALAWRSPRWWSRAVVVCVALAVVAPSILLSRRESRVWRSRGLRAEAVVLGARDVHDRHPDWMIFLDRVDTRLFWDIFPDEAFRAAETPAVYLTPSTAAQIAQLRPAPAPAKYALAIGSVPDLDRTIVFDASASPMRDITRAYINNLTDISQLPSRIDLASTLFDSFLGGAWHKPEAGFRWMGKQASIRLASPRQAGQALHIVAHCGAELLAAGPLTFEVSVNGAALPSVNLRPGRQDLSFPLPSEAASRQDLTVGLQVSRTFRPPGDGRDLGLPVVSIEVR